MGREKLSLPSHLVAAINAVKPFSFERFIPEEAWLYAASSPDYFNEILADRVALLHAQYGFNPPEHGDWVCADVVYLISGRLSMGSEKSFVYPLSSWDLKEPIDYLPSLEEMLELHFRMVKTIKDDGDLTTRPVTVEDIQEIRINTACQQLRDCETLLKLWVNRQSPRDQEQCFSSLGRKQIKQMLEHQDESINFAQEKLALFSTLEYPQFILDECHAKLYRECRISDQLKEVLRRTR